MDLHIFLVGLERLQVGLAIFGASIGPAVLAGGLLIRAVGSAAKGYASLNRRIAGSQFFLIPIQKQ